MEKSIYDEIGGFTFVRKLISDFYDKVLNVAELAVLFENSDMEKIIDHQTKFFAMLLGGPVSFTDEEIKQSQKRLKINASQFEQTKECLEDTLDDFDLDEDLASTILNAFESKRGLIVDHS